MYTVYTYLCVNEWRKLMLLVRFCFICSAGWFYLYLLSIDAPELFCCSNHKVIMFSANSGSYYTTYKQICVGPCSM